MKDKFDTSKYIFIPFENKGRTFKGCDCWGLVRLVYENEFNINLPHFSEVYSNASEGKKVAKALRDGKDIIKYKEKDKPEYGDVIIFNIAGSPCHVGVYVGRDRVLHIMKGMDSVIERLNSVKLKGRVEGYYEISS